MNQVRRKQIILAAGKVAQAKEMLEEAKEILEAARDEEQEYYDAMPENFQNGEKGENAQSALDALQVAVDDVESLIDDSAWDNIESNTSDSAG